MADSGSTTHVHVGTQNRSPKKVGKWNKKVAGIPQWGWATLGASVVVGYIIIRRRKAAATPATDDTGTATADTSGALSQSPYQDSGWGSGGGWGGGSGGTSGGTTTTPTTTDTATTTPTDTSATTGFTTSNVVSAANAILTPANTPALVGVDGNVQQNPAISNPVGYAASQVAAFAPVAAAAAAAGNPYPAGYVPYTPSQTDLATEQPGGLQYASVQAPNAPSNATYTVYNTTTGSGPVVPAAQRIVGERYDSLGRVIV